MHARWAKTCSCCGKLYQWLEWMELALVGDWDWADMHLQLRNCECGSTLGVERDWEGLNAEKAG